MNLSSFSHGQIISKIWLCEQLEPYLPRKPHVAILGGWHNVLGFMLLTRQPNRYLSILSIDIDPEVKEQADKISDAFMMSDSCIVKNVTGDANSVYYKGYNVIINCSVEHMNSNQWFDNIDLGSLVCLQSSNITDNNPPWDVVNSNDSLESLIKKYPLSHILFSGTKRIQYESWGYDRFMVIGIK